MAKQTVTVRLDEELVQWADGYAKERGSTRTDLLASAIESFRKDCESGVPELRQAAREQAGLRHSDRGVGDCQDRLAGLGHVWESAKENRSRPCVFCGKPGAEFLQEASAARSALFARLKTPDSAKGIKPKDRA